MSVARPHPPQIWMLAGIGEEVYLNQETEPQSARSKANLTNQSDKAICVRVCEEKGWSYEVYQDAEGHRSGRSEKHRPDRA